MPVLHVSNKLRGRDGQVKSLKWFNMEKSLISGLGIVMNTFLMNLSFFHSYH